MKSIIGVLTLIVLGILSTKSMAQHNGYNNYGYTYAGYTVTYETHMPNKVRRVVGKYHRHYGFNWVGTTEFRRGHKKFFVVTLKKGNRYIELTMNRWGDIVKRQKYAIDYRKRGPQRRVYANRQGIYYHNGYAYSRREDRRRYDYPWDNDWKNWDN